MTVEIRLLGPIEAAAEGSALQLRGQKRLGLLAILAPDGPRFPRWK